MSLTSVIVVVVLSGVAGIAIGAGVMWLRQRKDRDLAFQRGCEDTREQLEQEKNELAHNLGEKFIRMRDSLRDSIEAYQGAVECLVGTVPTDMRIEPNNTPLIETTFETTAVETAPLEEPQRESQQEPESPPQHLNGSGRPEDLPSVS